MTPRLLLPYVVGLVCLAMGSAVDAHEGDDAELRAHMVEAEFEMAVQSSELKLAELAIQEAAIDVEKIKLEVQAAERQGNKGDAQRAQLELKQASIRVDMRRVQAGMVRLQVERTKAHLAGLQKNKPNQPEAKDAADVRVEYLKDLDVFVLRGAKKDVEKVRALIEKAEKASDKKKQE